MIWRTYRQIYQCWKWRKIYRKNDWYQKNYLSPNPTHNPVYRSWSVGFTIDPYLIFVTCGAGVKFFSLVSTKFVDLIKNEHVFGDRNPTLACFSVNNFKLKMVLVSTKWQISCMVIDLRLLPTNNPSWPDPQLFPFFNLSVICILASFHYKSCAQMLMILKSSSTTQMALLHPFPF